MIHIGTPSKESTRIYINRYEKIYKLAFKPEDHERNIEQLKKQIWRGLIDPKLQTWLTDHHCETTLTSKGTLEELKTLINKWEDQQRFIQQTLDSTKSQYEKYSIQSLRQSKDKRSKYQTSDESSTDSDDDQHNYRRSKHDRKSSSKFNRRSSYSKPDSNKKLIRDLLKEKIRNSNYVGGRIIVKEHKIPDSIKSSEYYFGVKHYVHDQKQFTACLNEARREAMNLTDGTTRKNRKSVGFRGPRKEANNSDSDDAVRRGKAFAEDAERELAAGRRKYANEIN